MTVCDPSKLPKWNLNEHKSPDCLQPLLSQLPQASSRAKGLHARRNDRGAGHHVGPCLDGLASVLAQPRISPGRHRRSKLAPIWTAQRIYWLENRTYTANLHDLVGANMIDPSILTDTFYNYAVTGANMSTFTVTAERVARSLMVRDPHNHAGRRDHWHTRLLGAKQHLSRIPVRQGDS